MHTNIFIVIYFENGVLLHFLRNDFFRRPLKLNGINEGEEGCVPTSSDVLSDINPLTL
jgi:hypothetical protein